MLSLDWFAGSTPRDGSISVEERRCCDGPEVQLDSGPEQSSCTAALRRPVLHIFFVFCNKTLSKRWWDEASRKDFGRSITTPRQQTAGTYFGSAGSPEIAE